MQARVLISAILATSSVWGHGRLTIPATRKPTGYENDPVSGPDGTDFVCRNDPTALSGSKSQTKVKAGSEMSMRWDLSVNHEGDCAVYVGYGKALSSGKGTDKRDAEFVKIANVFDCKLYNGKEYLVDLPDWLPAGPAVIRWEWYAIHVWPTIEFYAQCADVIIESSSDLAVAELPSYPIVSPQLFPTTANDAPGFRCSPTRCIGSEQFQTGPPCAFEEKASKRNQCENTSSDTTGHLNPFGDKDSSSSSEEPVESSSEQPEESSSSEEPKEPTQEPTQIPTPTPGSCTNALWKPCGGKSNPDAPNCCPSDSFCAKQDDWYWQCRTDCPEGWSCDESPESSESPESPESSSSEEPEAPTNKPTTLPESESSEESGECPKEDASTLNVIGYYGNSGGQGCPNGGCIPALSDIPAEYNVLVLNFINFEADGSINFLVGGPQSKAALPQAIKAWKNTADPWGRKRHALVSLGGQNGNWPSGVSARAVIKSVVAFLNKYNLDGLDVDLEGGALAGASTVAAVVEALRARCFLIGAAPEAAQGPLNAYKELLHDLSWVHPQFYNNGPNAVTAPWTGNSEGTTPRNIGWNPTKIWQDTCSTCPPKEPFWYTILENIGFVGKLDHSQIGMLVPATTLAAGNNNIWDYAKLAANVEKLGVKHVGTWAIGHDATKNYQFAKSFTAVLDRLSGGEESSSSSEEPVSESSSSEDILEFSSFGEFKVWCASSKTEAVCKACLGRFKKNSCLPPKKSKKLKCKKIQDADLCAAVGCNLKKKNGKCQGKASLK